MFIDILRAGLHEQAAVDNRAADAWLHFVGPLVGGGVAALLYDRVFLPVGPKPPVVAAESAEERRDKQP